MAHTNVICGAIDKARRALRQWNINSKGKFDLKLVSIALVIAIVASSISAARADDSDLVKRFGRTCFTMNAEKRTLAIKLMAERQDDSDPIKWMESVKSAASIGHPNAFLFECRIGGDKLAPPVLVAQGRAWCIVGLEAIPALAKTLDPSFVAEITSDESKAALAPFVSTIKAGLCKTD